MLLRPVHRDGAPAHQHQHGRLPEPHDAFHQTLLRGRQVDPRAIAAVEAVDLDTHLLPFQPGGEAQAQDDHVGLPGDAHGLRLECFDGRGPQQLQLRLAVGLLSVHPQAIAPARLEPERLALCEARVRKLTVVCRIDRPDEQAVVQVQLELDGADQGEAVGPGDGRLEGGGPADAEIVAVHVRARRAGPPVGVQRGVHAAVERLAQHGAARKIGDVEAAPSPPGGEDGRGNAREHREPFGEIRAERVQDAGPR